MRSVWKFTIKGLTAVSFILMLSVVAFDRLVVAPALEKATALLAVAAPSERDLPDQVKHLLRRSLGNQVNFLVARSILASPPNQVEGMQTTARQFAELGVGVLLPLHLSESEILALLASQAYMGPGVLGFAQASAKYAGTPLEDASPVQIAKLVAISYAPSAYLDSPERLERRAQAILSKGSP